MIKISIFIRFLNKKNSYRILIIITIIEALILLLFIIQKIFRK